MKQTEVKPKHRHKEAVITVTKSNELIRKARYHLTTEETKILLLLFAMVNPKSEDLSAPIIISRTELCMLLGINANNGGNRACVDAALKHLRDQSYWVKSTENPKCKKLFYWISELESRELDYSIKLNPALEPHLLHLHGCFTTYALLPMLQMISVYSIRLFEQLLSIVKIGTLTMAVDELRSVLDATEPTFDRWADFKRRVLDNAVCEINEKTQYGVTVQYNTGGKTRAITSVTFVIRKKKDIPPSKRTALLQAILYTVDKTVEKAEKEAGGNCFPHTKKQRQFQDTVRADVAMSLSSRIEQEIEDVFGHPDD